MTGITRSLLNLLSRANVFSAEQNFTGGIKKNGSNIIANSDFIQSLATTGYQKLPSGLILQWVTFTTASNQPGLSITFPIAFPTAVYHADCYGNISALSTTGCTLSNLPVSKTQSVFAMGI